MRLRRLFLLFLLSLSLSLSLGSESKSPCSSRVRNLAVGSAVRQAVEAASLADQATGRDGAAFSVLRGTEAAHLAADLATDGEVISLGSGPDVFRPLRDFPLARRIHLVDLMTGWGKGPADVLGEIEQRLAALGPVELVSSGFVPEAGKAIQSVAGMRSWQHTHPTPRPRIWRVRVSGLPVTYLLHPVSYNSTASIGPMLDETTRLSAVMVTGAPIPDRGPVVALTAALAPGGVWLVEDFVAPKTGESVLGDLKPLLELLTGAGFDDSVHGNYSEGWAALPLVHLLRKSGG